MKKFIKINLKPFLRKSTDEIEISREQEREKKRERKRDIEGDIYIIYLCVYESARACVCMQDREKEKRERDGKKLVKSEVYQVQLIGLKHFKTSSAPDSAFSVF